MSIDLTNLTPSVHRRPVVRSLSHQWLILGLLILLGACGEESPAPATAQGESEATRSGAIGPSPTTSKGITESEARASHEKMLKALELIGNEAIENAPFFSVKGVERLDAALGAAKTDLERVQILVDRGAEQMKLGRIEAALESVEDGFGVLAKLPDEIRRKAEPQFLLRLGLTQLRAAEVANCLGMHNRESCILPIRGEGVHRDKAPSRKALEYLNTAVDVAEPGSETSLQALWLLNIAAMTLGEYPDILAPERRIPIEAFGPEKGFPRFDNVANEVGLATRNLSGGVVIDDLDGDLDLDILTSTWDPQGNVRFLRNDGAGGFQDATDEAGLRGITGGLNMIHADYDGDGDIDVVIMRGAWLREGGRHPNSLLRNDGKGHFLDVAQAAGIAGLAGVDRPTQAGAFADYDGDGDLDLYFGNEDTGRGAMPAQLFQNDGHGRFIDVAAAAGVTNDRYAKGAAWGDIDGDGDLDLYVSNLGAPNRLYRNDGNGLFTDIAEAAGVLEPQFSFPCWFFDFDNDGKLDIYVAAYVQDVSENVKAQIGQPSATWGRLYRGRGDGHFDDISVPAGLGKLVTTMGANFGDLDDDGFLDFYLGTGFPAYEALFPNAMYWNRGGRGFVDVTRSGGFGHLQKGHAIAFADLDADGDQDVFEQMGGAYPGDSFMDACYRNPGTTNHHVDLILEGRRSNRSAIGARVTVVTAQGKSRERFHRQVGAQGSFGSAPLRLHVGLGAADEIRRIEIIWPGQTEPEVVKGFELDRLYRIIEGREQPEELHVESTPF